MPLPSPARAALALALALASVLAPVPALAAPALAAPPGAAPAGPGAVPAPPRDAAAPRGPRNRVAVRLHPVTVINERASALDEFALVTPAGVQVGRLKAPLPPGKRAKLQVRAGCDVTVSAGFADGFEAADAALDLCRDRVVRFRS